MHMRFRATILLGGKTATGVEVPAEVVAGLGQGKRPPVRVTINGYTYRSTVAVMGGQFMLPVSAEVRERAAVAAGDQVDVDVELDTEPREVIVPPDLAEALDADVDARRSFDKLSYSNKRRIVGSIEEAKSVETRRRRIAKAVGTLREGRA
jgi:bifunctional DNA-binding transcriptional regulator/antitoxin component of YhaV-PrlF toxin-antitoxin module